jgi:hypothetical protein
VYRWLALAAIVSVVGFQALRFAETVPTDPSLAWSNLLTVLGTFAIAGGVLWLVALRVGAPAAARRKALSSRWPNATILDVQTDHDSLVAVSHGVAPRDGERKFTMLVDDAGVQLWGGSVEPRLVAEVSWVDVQSRTVIPHHGVAIVLSSLRSAVLAPIGDFGLLPATRRDLSRLEDALRVP